VHRGVTRGAGGHNSPAPIHYGGSVSLLEVLKTPNNVTSTSFNTVNLFSKELRFDHGDAKPIFAPGAT